MYIKYFLQNSLKGESMHYINILTCSDDLRIIVSFIKGILGLIQIVVPIILIIVGAFDLAKAVMGSDEKEIKAATQKLIKRAIAAVSVFFISTAVRVVMHYISETYKNQPTDSNGKTTATADTSSWAECWGN